MKYSLLIASLAIASTPLIAQDSSSEDTQSMFNGTLYTRASITYQYATDYYSGYNSTASLVFDTFDGEYSFLNYNVDLVYIMPNGFYLGTGLYSSAAKVKTDGTLGAPDTDSGIELREIPVSLGYDTNLDDVKLRFEARYTFNVDQDFNSSDPAVILPVTDGSDSLTLSVRAKKNFIGLEHSLTLGYQMYENGVTHPLFPSFSLGDRYIIDYDVSKVFGKLKLTGGHLFSKSQQTKGDTTGPLATVTAYLTEKPQYAQLRASATYMLSPKLYLDGGIKYVYAGKDAPKETTFYIGAAYLF
jgi:hypothetical protein